MCGACGTIWAQAFKRWASQICPDQVSQVLEVPTTWHRMRVHCWLKGPKRLPLLQYSNSTFFGLSFSGKFLFGNSNSDLYTPDIVKNRHGCWWKKEHKCDETLHLFGKSSPPPPPHMHFSTSSYSQTPFQVQQKQPGTTGKICKWSCPVFLVSDMPLKNNWYDQILVQYWYVVVFCVSVHTSTQCPAGIFQSLS